MESHPLMALTDEQKELLRKKAQEHNDLMEEELKILDTKESEIDLEISSILE